MTNAYLPKVWVIVREWAENVLLLRTATLRSCRESLRKRTHYGGWYPRQQHGADREVIDCVANQPALPFQVAVHADPIFEPRDAEAADGGKAVVHKATFLNALAETRFIEANSIGAAVFSIALQLILLVCAGDGVDCVVEGRATVSMKSQVIDDFSVGREERRG